VIDIKLQIIMTTIQGRSILQICVDPNDVASSLVFDAALRQPRDEGAALARLNRKDNSTLLQGAADLML
jgi:hypothetical protein